MSVLSEINRIKDAVTAIVNAIKGKGVTVPTNAKIHDLAPLIMSIPMDSGGASVETCNVTINFGASVGYVRIVATTFENGATKNVVFSENSGNFSIQNVVCGSFICLGGSIFDVSYDYAIGNISSNAYYLVAPRTAGDYTATIIEYED